MTRFFPLPHLGGWVGDLITTTSVGVELVARLIG